MLEGLELLQDILSDGNFKKNSLNELTDKINKVKNIVDNVEGDVVDIPDELLEQISILEDTINKSE